MAVQGINIYSGAPDPLGAALTNPTGLAVQKGKLKKGYPVVFKGRRWPDVETAYHGLKVEGKPELNDRVMAELISAKFAQHPQLLEDVEDRGGREFLLACGHFTNAKSAGFQSWEGQGLESRFIRNLVAGYDLAKAQDHTEEGQRGLF